MAVTDIEIYVRDLDEGRLLHWLNATCGSVREAWRNGGQVGFETARGPVILTARIDGGPFVGIAFPWGRARWPTDADCARQACQALGVDVRCDPGPGRFGATEDHVLEIAHGVEQLVLLLDDTLCVDRLIAEVPALRVALDQHVAANHELLPHVFFGDVTHFVVSGFDGHPERKADALKILALLEESMASPSEDVKNLVSVSFLENLLGEKPLDAIRAAMGPRLRAQLAKHEGS